MLKTLILAAFAVTLTATVFAAGPAPEKMSFTTSDNVTISGIFVKGKADKGPAVLLVHMLGRSKADWVPILENYLVPETPYSYLAIDLRGHGESTKQGDKEISYGNFKPEDWNSATNDIEAAVKYLRGRPDVDPGQIAIVGASIGANLAIRYAAGDPDIKAVALLSPGVEYRGVKSPDAMAKYGDRPVFLAATHEDAAAAQGVQALSRAAKGTKVVELYQGNLHGTRMFGAYPLDKQLTDFLKANLK